MTSRALALTLVVAGAACTGGASAPVTTAPPTTAPSPSPVASPATTEPVVTSTETFDTFLPEPMELTDQVVDYNGGASLGDSYYPELGNAGYDVTHVGLDVDLRTAEQGRFTGVATLHITPLEPLETFVIDTGTVVVSDVWEVTTHTPDEWVRSRWARESATEHRIGLAGITDEPFEVRIEYRGVPEPVRHPSIPLELGLRPGPDSWFAVSEPVGATTWFPANDHPRDKATYTIRLTVPAGMEGIAGGLLTDTQAAIGGGSTFTWEFRQPVASYLVGLAVGEFTRIDRDAVGDVTLRDYVDPDAGADLGGLDRTGEILTWMTEVFGPYPFDAYGTLVVDTAFGGALENQTLAIHDPGALSTTVIVHEMAHQWFGNSVSLCDWSDVWLNEGFATYVEWLWVEHDRGSDLYEAIARQGFERYLELPAPGRPPRDDLFNGGVYLGGATVLHHLRAELGDGPFFALLRTYAAEFAHGNASTAEFVDMAERFAARQLDEFFDTWLSGSGEAYVPLR